MKLETEQLLGTLEVIVWHPSRIFVWETEEQGEFNVWNLAIAEGFVSLTDVDVAIAHWQAVERWGTPTDQSKNDYEYAPPRNEREDGWNSEIEAKRFESYQQLSQLLKAELQDLQAFKFSIPKSHHLGYCFYIIIGKTDDENWLCFSPTVPDQVTYNFLNQIIIKNQIKSPSDQTLELQSRIKSILAELQPIQLYGYYYGAYNYTYQHKIIYTISQEKALAIELTLQSAGMLRVEKENVQRGSNEYNSEKLNRFFNTNLGNKVVYTLSFWDIAYTYEIGQAPTGDWLGVRSLLEFEYNP